MTKISMQQENTYSGPGPSYKDCYSGLQILDLKQLADMEDNYKKQCRRAIKDYRYWRSKHSRQTDMMALLYGNLEGIMLRRRAEDSTQAYWIIRRDFRRLFADYLAQHHCYPSHIITKKSA
jgi:hypothetical protein